MTFAVRLKGIQCFAGRLSSAYDYIQKKWGSNDAAWLVGVKLVPVADLRTSTAR